MRPYHSASIAIALLAPSLLRAQSETFGQLQFSMPKAVREQTADYVSVTDSSKNAVCRYVVLKQNAGNTPANDYKAAYADMQRIVGVPIPFADPTETKTLPSGHVLSTGGGGGDRKGGGGFTTELFVYSGGGQRLTAFRYSTSMFRCLGKNTSFSSSLAPVGTVTVASNGTTPGANGGGNTPRPSSIPPQNMPQTAPSQAPQNVPQNAPSQAPQNSGGGGVSAPTNGPRGMNGWAFNSTTFSDGWTSSIKEGWVEGVKGDVMVRLHHPSAESEKYYSDSNEKREIFWNLLITPRYRNISNRVIGQIPYMSNSWEPAVISWADAEEIATGKRVHVVLFYRLYRTRKDWGRWMEFVVPDHATFEREFGGWGAEGMEWDRMAALHGLNRFPVALSDLNGEWTDQFQSYVADTYNVVTGQYTGSLVNAFGDRLVVNGARYQRTITWNQMLNGVNRSAQDVWAGSISVPDMWHVYLTGAKHAPTERNLDAWFEAVRGGRILVLDKGNTRFAKAR